MTVRDAPELIQEFAHGMYSLCSASLPAVITIIADSVLVSELNGSALVCIYFSTETSAPVSLQVSFSGSSSGISALGVLH